jgi:hypothetical protein
MWSGPIVCKPLVLRERSSRSLDERVGLRFPRPAAAYGRLIGRLGPDSRLRQALVLRAVRQSGEAFNRGDVEAFLLNRRGDCEWYPPHEFVEAGFLSRATAGRLVGLTEQGPAELGDREAGRGCAGLRRRGSGAVGQGRVPSHLRPGRGRGDLTRGRDREQSDTTTPAKTERPHRPLPRVHATADHRPPWVGHRDNWVPRFRNPSGRRLPKR